LNVEEGKGAFNKNRETQSPESKAIFWTGKKKKGTQKRNKKVGRKFTSPARASREKGGAKREPG